MQEATESRINFDDLKVNGIKINYYLICKRKLWFYDKKITMEHNSEKVKLGKLLHENSYKEKKKEVLLDDMICIDILDKNTINEVKSSDKMEEVDVTQILYYLYYLKQNGIIKKGIINYPKQRKRDFIELTLEKELEIEKILLDINNILKIKKPPELEKKSYCTKCAYYELCFA
ncbi:MAG: CRISPR-associated protein Cas4 [Candidatus Sericytochromatia bacterium]